VRICWERGCHVVSTCEELSFPDRQAIREDLQQAARAHNGHAPRHRASIHGFVMDKLPLTLTSVCQDIKVVDIIRIQKRIDAPPSRCSGKSAPE